MNKKTAVLLIFLAGLSMVCCKKTDNYTCSCITTEVDSVSNGGVASFSYLNTSIAYSAKMTETQAKSACTHEAGAVDSNMEAIETGNGTHAGNPKVKYVTACQLN